MLTFNEIRNMDVHEIAMCVEHMNPIMQGAIAMAYAIPVQFSSMLIVDLSDINDFESFINSSKSYVVPEMEIAERIYNKNINSLGDDVKTQNFMRIVATLLEASKYQGE